MTGGDERTAEFDDLLELDDRDDEDDLGDFESELEKLDARRDEAGEELRPIDVGDHVAIRDEDEDERATMVVLETPLDETATSYKVDGLPLTEFDGNAECPPDDDVVVVTYPSRTDVRLTDGRSYAYPRSRLEVVAGVHDRDDDDEGGDEE